MFRVFRNCGYPPLSRYVIRQLNSEVGLLFRYSIQSDAIVW